MRKIYNKKVQQYSIDGEKLELFPNAKEATHIVNYDSIINCCRGKYKTAGGFIWRFEDDEFDLGKTSTGDITCKICGSKETTRSMAMHLKWTHNIKTEEYIQKYGDFRAKNIKEQNAKEKSEILCQVCGEKMKNNRQLMYHLTKSHPEVTKGEYIITNILGKTPLCKCGCGQPVTLLPNGNNCDLGKPSYYRDYIKGHWDWEVFKGIGKQSKEEIEIQEYIKSIYNKTIQNSVRDIIEKSELDIYLPEDKIAIEYNGLYWHSDRVGKDESYHIKKWKKCQNKGIRLIQIFSDEWMNKKEIVKKKLNSIINNTKSGSIFARKCTIKEIFSKDKNLFLNNHHIQGEDRSSIKLGLYHENILVSVMTFSNPRICMGGDYSNKDIYELSRFASSSYIVGGLQKLLKYFSKTYNPKQIYSYSDNRWTDPLDNVYLKSGFTLANQSKPNYFYTKDFLNRIHRYNFNKHRLKKMGMDCTKTEAEIMKELGYAKIWDCGTTKYIMNF